METQMMCKCGHSLEDHHVSYFVGGARWAEECEFYGSNEEGGMMPPAEDVPGGWVAHCRQFIAAP